MRIAVFGAGGVGGYFGGRLAQLAEMETDLQVVFVARGEHLKAMLSDGLRVDSPQGDFLIKPVQAASEPARLGQVDAVLLAVKAWQVPEAALEMLPLIGAETFVVPLQNGVDAPGQLVAVLGKEHVLGGLCRISSSVVAPGHIRHAGIEPYVAFAELDRRSGQRAERLRAAFERAGVKAEIPADIQAAMWEKFLFIAALSGVGAVTRAPAGVLRTVPESRQLLKQAMEEIVAVAQAHKVELPEDAVRKTLEVVDGLPASVIASMQRDILEGRPSELAAQNGAVMRLGLERGVATPVHTFLYYSLLPQELRARGEVQF
jgi:2-dehydropantoate 2-reductase